jgi:hypothetical protein
VGTLTARSLVVWAALLAFTVGATACSVQLNRRPAARLRVVADTAEASVYVDERFAGSARVLDVRPKAFSEGEHRVTVTAPGHFPHDLSVDLVPGTTTVRIELRPVPP